ncbi:MAG: 3-deoxy-7-phosphoheptulonate synthase [Lautropia sp.]
MSNPAAPAASGDSDRTSATDDARIASLEILPPPEHLIRFFPIAGSPVEHFIAERREQVRRVVAGDDDRLLVLIGPCSIHDPKAALEYAQRLVARLPALDDALLVVMRVYFEKPRTTVGWKGLINDPGLDGSNRIAEGLRMARQLLVEVNALGLPAGGELLDTLSPQYVADLLAWGAIGARTTESQVHRELASGFSAPVGYKNSTDGAVDVAIDAIVAAAHPHSFLGVHKSGQVAMVRTLGNPDGHVILRGGREPNWDAGSVAAAGRALAARGLRPSVMIDCSHANSGKRHERQIEVVEAVAEQIAAAAGPTPALPILGVMIESHLEAGAQSLSVGKTDPKALRYGQSVTDACIGWSDSVRLLDRLADAVRRRRGRAGTAA